MFILYSFKYIDSVRNECISLFLPFVLVIKVLIINKVDINISNVHYFLIHCTLPHILYHISNQKEKYFNFFLNFLTYFDNSWLINEVDVNTSIFWHFLISLIIRSAHTKFQTKRTSPSPFLELSHLLDKPWIINEVDVNTSIFLAFFDFSYLKECAHQILNHEDECFTLFRISSPGHYLSDRPFLVHHKIQCRVHVV